MTDRTGLGLNESKVGKTKKWLVIGDLHDETVNIQKIPELFDVEGIIVSGDLTQLGGISAAEKVMNILGKTEVPVYAQTGNMDKPEIDSWLTEKGTNIHARVVKLAPNLSMFGIGGSTPTPFNTPTEYSEDAYMDWLKKCWETASRTPLRILVSHNPPKDTLCDTISSGLHVGSRAVRDFIEECQPDLCICGHIHEARGIDQIGKTRIINPGMLSEGGYALITLSGDILEGDLRQIPG